MPRAIEFVVAVLRESVVDVLPDLIAKALPVSLVWRLVRAVLPATQRSHNRETASRIERMPFRPPRLPRHQLVLDDFVDVELRASDRFALEDEPVSSGIKHQQSGHKTVKPYEISPQELVRERHKAIFLAQAGSGKTTLLRRECLSIIKRRTTNLLPKPAVYTPVYVPLKLVDNASPYPILEYILSQYRYFRGSLGERRLLTLARQRRLFLAIDGYDEIQLTAEGNHVRQELNYLLGPHGANKETFPKIGRGAFAALFYSEMITNRVWLSSRPDFFRDHRISIPTDGPRTVAVIELHGLGVRRQALVERVFTKYRELEKYRSILDAEQFMRQLESSDDKELTEYSFLPLFLTVMATLYVSRLDDADGVPFAKSVNQVVTEYLQLLISGLDRARAQDLDVKGSEHRAPSITSRRAQYPDEKFAFLKFFAAQLYFDGVAVFGVDYIKIKSRQFFAQHATPASQHIIKELDHERYSIVEQLRRSNVFIEDSRTATAVNLDFPHKRFRDVLATEEVDSKKDTFDDALKKAALPSVRELMFVAYSIGSQSESIVRTICHRIVMDPRDPYYGVLLLGCLRRTPKWFDASPAVADFLQTCIERELNPTAQPEILQFCDSRLEHYLMATIPAALKKRRQTAFSLACVVLLNINPRTLMVLLDNLAGDCLAEQWSARVWLRCLLSCSLDLVHKHFNEVQKQRAVIWDFCYLATRIIPSARHSEILDKFGKTWSAEEQMIFCRFWMRDKSTFPSAEWELYAIIVKAKAKPEVKEGIAITSAVIEEFAKSDTKREDLLVLRQNVGRLISVPDIKYLELSDKAAGRLTDISIRERANYQKIASVVWESYSEPKWDGLLFVELSSE